MDPDLLLAVVTALASFILKTTVAFAVCLALSWQVDSPGRRFVVWLGFLYGMAAYWLWLAVKVLGIEQSVALTPVTAIQSASSRFGSSGFASSGFASSGFGALQMPASWSFPMAIGLRVIGISYVLILSYMLLAHINKLRQLKWVMGFASEPPSEIAAAFQPLANNLHVGRSRLLMLSGATSPATFGWIRPTVVLPDVCREQDSSQLDAILRHELHHVRRLDFLWNGLAILCRALLFFHPAAWYAVKKMEFDRELACDLAAVSDSPKGRARYAECLIHFARINSSPDSRNWGLDFAASPAQLKARVHSILAGAKKRSLWLVGSRVVCGLALLAGFLGIEPSLGVLLTYAHQQIAQPLAAEMRTMPAKRAIRARATSNVRTPRASMPVGAATDLSQTFAPADLSAEHRTDGVLSAQSNGGPQLLHRGWHAPGGARKQQTVISIDDGPGQTTKAGVHDREQAIQQTVTAAADLYGRIADLDRR